MTQPGCRNRVTTYGKRCLKPQRNAAEDILGAAHKHLYNKERQAFYKGVLANEHGIIYDDTIDLSSIFGAFMFGLFPVGSPELTAAVATMERTFNFQPGVNGLPRYENDNYYRVNFETPGNWWNITTLWMAQYYAEVGKHEDAEKILSWVTAHAVAPTGVMAEQINPDNGASLSVAPLTWSHAEYVATLLDTITEKHT